MATPLADREDIYHDSATRSVKLGDTISHMYWQVAPDHRMLRTLDWMSDACEAKLRAKDRTDGAVTYDAIMSPIRVQISHRRGRTRSVAWPVSVLITDKWLIVATKKRLGRRAWVHKLDRVAITSAAEQNKAAKRPKFQFVTDEECAKFNELLPNVTADIGTWSAPKPK